MGCHSNPYQSTRETEQHTVAALVHVLLYQLTHRYFADHIDRLIWLYFENMPTSDHKIWWHAINSLLQASGRSLHSFLMKCHPQLQLQIPFSTDLFEQSSAVAATLPDLRHLSLEGKETFFSRNNMARHLLTHFKGCQLETLEMSIDGSEWASFDHQLAKLVASFKSLKRLSLKIDRPSRNTHSDFANILQTIVGLTSLTELQLQGGMFKAGPEAFLVRTILDASRVCTPNLLSA